MGPQPRTGRLKLTGPLAYWCLFTVVLFFGRWIDVSSVSAWVLATGVSVSVVDRKREREKGKVDRTTSFPNPWGLTAAPFPPLLLVKVKRLEMRRKKKKNTSTLC